MELDHIFICTSNGAPEAELLKAFGLTEGSRSVHPGQGTVNRRFFFHNAMLELLWISDPNEARCERTRPTGLFERCSLLEANVSPFGFCFRPSSPSESRAPFPAWDYKPTYLPGSLVIEVGESPLYEPMWFYFLYASRPDSADGKKRQPLSHKIGFIELTAAIVSIPSNIELSLPAVIADSLDNFFITLADKHLIELEFDGGAQGKAHDFRPSLPLVFRW